LRKFFVGKGQESCNAKMEIRSVLVEKALPLGDEKVREGKLKSRPNLGPGNTLRATMDSRTKERK